jgi:hypothetical protein
VRVGVFGALGMYLVYYELVLGVTTNKLKLQFVLTNPCNAVLEWADNLILLTQQ